MNKVYTNSKNLLLIGVGTFLLVVFDQLTKWLAYRHFETPYYLIGKSVRFVLELNQGIAFSVPVPSLILVSVTPAIGILFIVYTLRYVNLRRTISMITASMFLAGTLGNFIDRIARGAVVDFIAVGWYPVFNVADVYLTVGVFLFIAFYSRIIRTA